jgi:hypothetical protein
MHRSTRGHKSPDLPRTFPGWRIIRHFGQFENLIMRAIYDAVAGTDLFFGYNHDAYVAGSRKG